MAVPILNVNIAFRCRRCPVMERNALCSYRLKIGDSEPWLEICELVRNRVSDESKGDNDTVMVTPSRQLNA